MKKKSKVVTVEHSENLSKFVGKAKRNEITIDITDWYDEIEKVSRREMRSIEDQCRFFIKKALENDGERNNIYITPYTETAPDTKQNTPWQPSYPWVTYPCGPSVPSYPDINKVYCGDSTTSGVAVAKPL